MWSIQKMMTKDEDKKDPNLNSVSDEIFQFLLDRYNLPANIKAISIHLEFGEAPIFEIECYPVRKTNVH